MGLLINQYVLWIYDIHIKHLYNYKRLEQETIMNYNFLMTAIAEQVRMHNDQV